MFFFSTQIASVANSSIEAQLANCSLLTSQAYDLLQKILALTIAIVSASVQQAGNATCHLQSGRAA